MMDVRAVEWLSMRRHLISKLFPKNSDELDASMTDFTIDDGDPEIDKSFILAIENNLEVRNTQGNEPGRTARLERLVREGYLEPFNWFNVTEKGKKFAGLED
jgi:hypothetical protein